MGEKNYEKYGKGIFECVLIFPRQFKIAHMLIT